MSNAQTPLTAAMFNVLLALSDGDKHGYAILKEVEEQTAGEVQLSTGTLYGIIKRLLAEGLICEVRTRPAASTTTSAAVITGSRKTGRHLAVAEAERLEKLLERARSKRSDQSLETALGENRGHYQNLVCRPLLWGAAPSAPLRFPTRLRRRHGGGIPRAARRYGAPARPLRPAAHVVGHHHRYLPHGPARAPQRARAGRPLCAARHAPQPRLHRGRHHDPRASASESIPRSSAWSTPCS